MCCVENVCKHVIWMKIMFEGHIPEKQWKKEEYIWKQVSCFRSVHEKYENLNINIGLKIQFKNVLLL